MAANGLIRLRLCLARGTEVRLVPLDLIGLNAAVGRLLAWRIPMGLVHDELATFVSYSLGVEMPVDCDPSPSFRESNGTFKG